MRSAADSSLRSDATIALRRRAPNSALPEIKLGLIPGAGGTQRLPRLIGAQPALEIMLKGDPIDAKRAHELGIIDDLVDGEVVETAMRFARYPRKRISARQAELGIKGLASSRRRLRSRKRTRWCHRKIAVDSLRTSLSTRSKPRSSSNSSAGSRASSGIFDELVRSAPAHALMHVFFAERELGKIPGLEPSQPLEIKTAAVIGGGTMGTGIAITFASAGIPVTVVEPKDEQIERSRQIVFGTYSYQVQRGRMTQEEAWKRGQSIAFERDLAAVKDADIVVEAVFENMDVKKEVFTKLDGIAKPGAILASNTSTLDIDAMAAQTKRPGRASSARTSSRRPIS